ncbi:MAG: 2-hydroxyacid dehydrogenase [Cytophagales bacterium]|nr:2-hydroxyacid dehydrogenase [Cytophagales bacterium]
MNSKNPVKVAFFSTKSYDQEYFDQANQDLSITYFEASLDEQTVNLCEGYEVVCAFVNDKLDNAVLDRLHAYGIKLIALRCAGFNNVNLDVAKELGIKVVRVPSYSPEAVAEHAVALMLSLNRKTNKAYNRVREGNFSLHGLVGFDLYKKTVGVIGTGKIGQAFCRIMKGFGTRVLAYDLYPSEALAEDGVEYVSLEDLFKNSDVVSMHCPLTPDSSHLINEQTISMMKPGVMLINTSRGGLINTKDVIAGLKSRHIGYLGIDVYEQEESLFFKDLSAHIIQDDLIMRLISFPNVLITAHQAFLTQEALSEIARTTLENIHAFEQGELQNSVY